MLKKKICFVVAIPVTAQSFLRDHIDVLSKEYDIYLIGDVKDEKEMAGLKLVGWHRIRIKRGISIVNDMKAVWQTFRYFRKERFDAVHSVTPKAGLVAAIAGWMARIKHRTHIFTGQVWATKAGTMRWLLKVLDKVIVRLDNHILVDGMSQRAYLEKEGVLQEGQSIVFHKGSISGVNSLRFNTDHDARVDVRRKIGINDHSLTFIFLGRLNHDKGIGELFEAFNRLAEEKNEIFLLLVGNDEEGYIKNVPQYKNIEVGKNFYFYGPTPQPEKVLNAGDVFVLPTYREGFGTSVIEAACVGLPCICSDAYGVLDAYVENETGLRCHVGDVDSLYQCMKKMCENQDLVREMGIKSRQRALADFSSECLTRQWVNFYHSLL